MVGSGGAEQVRRRSSFNSITGNGGSGGNDGEGKAVESGAGKRKWNSRWIRWRCGNRTNGGSVVLVVQMQIMVELTEVMDRWRWKSGAGGEQHIWWRWWSWNN